MSILGNFTKQPVDVVDYDIDYSEWLSAQDNVQSCDVSVSPAGLTLGQVFVNDPCVKIWVSGGTNGVTYKVTATTTTADGRVKEDEFRVRVKEV